MRKILLILLFVLLFLCDLFGNKEIVGSRFHPREKSTMEELLQTVVLPIGQTMYIWGGGWDVQDEGAGAGATQIGVSPDWEEFACAQTKEYDFEDYRYEREKGLDCSGYVGWVVYNMFKEKDGQESYVTTSTDMAEFFAYQGWGKLIKNPKEFKPGDIVSMNGHVWISLGSCADGSVLLAHSSPPGVSICGTKTPDGDTSIAIELATEYMTKNHPDWQEKYPNRAVSDSYLEDVIVMRWNSKTLSDVHEYQDMSGEEIYNLL